MLLFFCVSFKAVGKLGLAESRLVNWGKLNLPYLEMANMENAHIEKDRIENAHHGKIPKIQTLENGRQYTSGKWQNGKCTTRKKTENARTGKWQKMHTQKLPELSLP